MCSFCDERYVHGHKCNAQVYKLEIFEDEGEDCVEQSCEDDRKDVERLNLRNEMKEVPYLSLQAMTGTNNFQTMRITEKVKNYPFHILIDSGSTHNFLDPETAKRLHCRTWVIPPLQVSVPNGSKRLSTAMCKNFNWVLHG